jgi:hypothetical protein
MIRPMPESAPDYEPVLRIAVGRALRNADATGLPLHFEAAVLGRYRESSGYSIIRTNSVGRVRKDGGWWIDFGIAPDETLLHVTFADLQRLPEAEQEHWAGFATALPSSRTFLQMRLAPGSCYDDGEVRSW